MEHAHFLDLSTIIVVNTVTCVIVSLMLLVSRMTLGQASAGAASWVVGDVLIDVANVLALVDRHSSMLPWLDPPRWQLLPEGVSSGALVVAAICWHARALNRVEGRSLTWYRVAGESLLVALLWIGLSSTAFSDGQGRLRALAACIGIGALVTMPPAFRLARHFWGARMIFAMMCITLVAMVLRVTVIESFVDQSLPAELVKAFIVQIIVGLTLTLSFLILIQEQVRKRLSELSRTDPLTGLLNRRGLLDLLERDLERARRAHRPLSLVLFDIDHFKRINDREGHAVGDLVLQHFADCLATQCRRGDMAARWGGEEFVVVLPETSLSQATQVAERIRQIVRSTPTGYHGLPITVSGGVVEADFTDEAGQGIDHLIQAADRRMYQAKSTRDCVSSTDAADAPAIDGGLVRVTAAADS